MTGPPGQARGSALTAPRVALLGTAMTALSLVVLLVVTAAVGHRVIVGSSEAPGIDVAGLPGVGEIRFGDAVDPTTFTLAPAAPGAGVPAGMTVAALAHLSAPVGPESLTIAVEAGGSEIARQSAPVEGPDRQDLVTWTFVPPVAGDLRVRLLGEDGTVLAEGTLLVR
jgi:hypothetical protein